MLNVSLHKICGDYGDFECNFDYNGYNFYVRKLNNENCGNYVVLTVDVLVFDEDELIEYFELKGIRKTLEALLENYIKGFAE